MRPEFYFPHLQINGDIDKVPGFDAETFSDLGGDDDLAFIENFHQHKNPWIGYTTKYNLQGMRLAI